MEQLLNGNAAVVGLQWGDEGKGKIVDCLAEAAQVVCRYCGGANAGHTVKIGGEKFATHLLPVGVMRPGVVSYVGNGVVLDPFVLAREIDAFNARGVPVSPANLKISYKAHVVLPYHQAEDAAREEHAATAAGGGQSIGTTRRGIGPAYADKMHRTSAVRAADFARPEKLREKVLATVERRNELLTKLYGAEPIDGPGLVEQLLPVAARLAPFVDDVGRLLLADHAAGRKVIFEGAHAALLDVDHGTYPFVTSSSCSSLGIYAGSGVPPKLLKNVVGVLKAYSTRVGGGPFPTELIDGIPEQKAMAHYIREKGHEYGTTTGRPRRVGWFDGVAARYACDLSGTTAIALTLLDVLGGIDELKVCTGYKLRDGSKLDYFRTDVDLLEEVTCEYETLPGWEADLSQCEKLADLPREAEAYIERIEAICATPVRLISIGAERKSLLARG
ncbi:MAG: adenylosuccinate synthase [Phycisphaerae bacterium]